MGLKEFLLSLWTESKGLAGDSVNSLFRDNVAKKKRELSTYWEYYNTDCTVGMSVDSICEMIAGVGHYPSVKDVDKDEKALNIINELADKIRLDEMMLNVTKCMEIFGFCPVERISDNFNGITEMIVHDPLTFSYKRDEKGKMLGYEQNIKNAKPITFKPDEIVWFINNEVGNAQGVKYGISRVARVLNLLEVRDQVVKNINGIMKNQSRPPILWKVQNENDVAVLKEILKNCKTNDTDPIMYPAESIQHDVVKIDTKSAYWEYVGYIDGLIFEGLHAPMLNYLRNATEASANSMLDAINRHVDGKQRYLKRMIEHEIYEHHLKLKKWTGETPTFNWGAEQTGLEDIDIGQLMQEGLRQHMFTPSQYHAILKSLGINIPEPEADEPTAPALQPNDPSIPVPKQGDEPPAPPLIPQDPEEISNEDDDDKYDYVVRRQKRASHNHKHS